MGAPGGEGEEPGPPVGHEKLNFAVERVDQKARHLAYELRGDRIAVPFVAYGTLAAYMERYRFPDVEIDSRDGFEGGFLTPEAFRSVFSEVRDGFLGDGLDPGRTAAIEGKLVRTLTAKRLGTLG